MTGNRGRGSQRTVLLCLAAFLSGAAALSYELLWIRQLGETFGNTVYAVYVVLAVFFLGLGVGAFFIGRFADLSGGSVRVFCALELVIAICGALVGPGLGAVERLYLSLAPAEWAPSSALAFKAGAAGLLLAVPTVAMGGTLPALVRHAVRSTAELTPRLGWLYGLNTLGAALGSALVVFVFIPALGLPGSTAVAVVLNLGAAACAWTGRHSGDTFPTPAPERQVDGPRTAAIARARVLLATAALSGFLSVGLEVLWTRALASRFMGTVYSFATILFVYLVALALGSIAIAALDRRGLVRKQSAAVVMIAAGLAALASVSLLARVNGSEISVIAMRGFGGAQLRELGVAVLVMSLPILMFGLMFPLLCRLAHRELAAVGKEVGGLYLANTVGSVAAPLLIGFWVLPLLGMRDSLLATGWVALAFGLGVLMPWSGATRRYGTVTAVVAGGLALGLTLSTGGDLRVWRTGPNDRLLYYREGAAASVAVVEMPGGDRALMLNRDYRLGDTRTRFAQARQALIPLLLAPEPRKTLMLGMGTGGSAGAAVALGGLSVDVLEIVPGLAETLPFFRDTNENLWTRLRDDPEVRLLEVDARHFVRATDRRYDVVIGDLFVPWRAGEGAMYTREHFAAVRELLEPGGLFCQWLPLYQLGDDGLRTIVATFCTEFPEVHAFWLYFNVDQPVIGLVGSREPLSLDPAEIELRLGREEAAELLGRAGLLDTEPLVGSWIAGRRALERWSAGAPLETRARPRIEFSAPFDRVRGRNELAAESLEAVLALTEPLDTCSLLAEWPAALRQRSSRYQRAIAHFFRGKGALSFAADPALALREYGAALKETPDWDWISFNLGQLVELAIRDGHSDLAQRGAKLLEDSAHAHLAAYYRAYMAFQHGDRAQADHYAKEALRLDPTHAGSRELLDELRRREDESR